jgi:lantibiotic modifying enzyme
MSRINPSWTHLLERDEREAALNVADGICGRIARELEEILDDGLRLGSFEPGLSRGYTGLAVLLGYASRVFGNQHFEDLAFRAIAISFSESSASPIEVGLFRGVAGIAWGAGYVASLCGEAPPEELSAVDNALFVRLAQEQQHGSHDLVAGLTGVGVYAAARMGATGDARLLGAVVHALARLAEHQPSGATWFTPPERLPEATRELAPQGWYNLGVAHGVPAVATLLAIAASSGVEADVSRHLADSAQRWLRRHTRRADGLRFATWVSPGTENDYSRLAWCYGDPGIAGSLLLAGDSLDDEELRTFAIELGVASTRADASASGVSDACFCHGSSGLMHIYNRLFQSTGNGALRDAALHWARVTLGQHQAGSGFGGYSFSSYASGGYRVRGHPGLLEGAAGVALSLLAAAADEPPGWDMPFLLSAPTMPFTDANGSSTS